MLKPLCSKIFFFGHKLTNSDTETYYKLWKLGFSLALFLTSFYYLSEPIFLNLYSFMWLVTSSLFSPSCFLHSWLATLPFFSKFSLCLDVPPTLSCRAIVIQHFIIQSYSIISLHSVQTSHEKTMFTVMHEQVSSYLAQDGFTVKILLYPQREN